ncbi:hypothetical protein MFLAVUS_003525 [Mucor flavus]|uniref:Uncharacterized protein n=1 Tax=Mucor flavus TaxID=439312 RepID=A0ABP9YTA8_9FUNG
MSLNSIIDLSDSQKRYFNKNEWNSMKEYYKFKTKLTEIRNFDRLDKLNGKLKELNLVDTYTLARKLEVKNLESSNEVLFKIYAHIVDMYRFYSEALRFKTNEVTELDSLMKIWGGILKPLLPNTSRVYKKKR